MLQRLRSVSRPPRVFYVRPFWRPPPGSALDAPVVVTWAVRFRSMVHFFARAMGVYVLGKPSRKAGERSSGVQGVVVLRVVLLASAAWFLA